jgi:thymidylate synthase
MHISADTLDDALRGAITKLLKSKSRPEASRGKTRELFGALIEVRNPLARLSRTERKGTIFSALGELLWYLARTNDLAFIAYYAENYAKDSDDGVTLHGAYGPRLFNFRGLHNQIDNVLALLRQKPTSRRAVIQLFDASDLERDYKEIPCTTTLQFVVRNQRLDMLTTMRSNDVFIGLPHDVFAFTMLQELMARSLGLSLGTYKHAVGSLHLYEDRIEEAKAYLKEGWQSTIAMPRMPDGDPWSSVSEVLRVERALREDGRLAKKRKLAPYWEDFVLLLRIYKEFTKKRQAKILALKKRMNSSVFDPYIDKKRFSNPKPRAERFDGRKGQLALFTTGVRSGSAV